MSDINAEIERVKTAMAKTKSSYLLRDYGKYLRRLERMANVSNGRERNQAKGNG